MFFFSSANICYNKFCQTNCFVSVCYSNCCIHWCWLFGLVVCVILLYFGLRKIFLLCFFFTIECLLHKGFLLSLFYFICSLLYFLFKNILLFICCHHVDHVILADVSCGLFWVWRWSMIFLFCILDLINIIFLKLLFEIYMNFFFHFWFVVSVLFRDFFEFWFWALNANQFVDILGFLLFFENAKGKMVYAIKSKNINFELYKWFYINCLIL